MNFSYKIVQNNKQYFEEREREKIDAISIFFPIYFSSFVVVFNQVSLIGRMRKLLF